MSKCRTCSLTVTEGNCRQIRNLSLYSKSANDAIISRICWNRYKCIRQCTAMGQFEKKKTGHTLTCSMVACILFLMFLILSTSLSRSSSTWSLTRSIPRRPSRMYKHSELVFSGRSVSFRAVCMRDLPQRTQLPCQAYLVEIIGETAGPLEGEITLGNADEK